MSHFFQNVCIVSQVYIYLKSPDESFRMARKRNKTKKYCAENAIMYYYLAEGSIKAVDHANFCCSCVPLSNISLFKQVVVVETFMLEKPPQYLPVVQLKKL